VIPSIREDALNIFLDKWRNELASVQIIVVEDNNEKTFNIKKQGLNLVHFSHKEIEEDLKENAWIIPRKTSAICSYGFYKAWHMGMDLIIKLDDDLEMIEPNFIIEHMKNVYCYRPLHWANPFIGGYPRGFPYSERTRITVLNYGLADNILDFDAISQLLGDRASLRKEGMSVPYGSYIPLSGMNVAFIRDIIPAYYFLLMGKGFGFDRCDDIWSGIFLKKITDHLGHVISVGPPIVKHNKLSNPISNFYKETPMLDVNEVLWQKVDKIKLTKYNYKDCYLQIAEGLPKNDKYFKKLAEAMKIWISII
jgi:hypothetical protein